MSISVTPARAAFSLVVAIAATGLGGCFGSRAQLIEAKESQKLFGDQGVARRVLRLGGPVETVRFGWTGDAYVLAEGESLAPEPARYRLARLSGGWLLTQKWEGSVASYGLARRDGAQLWTYAVECRLLTDADRQAIGLTMQTNSACMVATYPQLREAMLKIAARNPKPDGYFELVGATP
jgi:hypothetical protein